MLNRFLWFIGGAIAITGIVISVLALNFLVAIVTNIGRVEIQPAFIKWLIGCSVGGPALFFLGRMIVNRQNNHADARELRENGITIQYTTPPTGRARITFAAALPLIVLFYLFNFPVSINVACGPTSREAELFRQETPSKLKQLSFPVRSEKVSAEINCTPVSIVKSYGFVSEESYPSVVEADTEIINELMRAGLMDDVNTATPRLQAYNDGTLAVGSGEPLPIGDAFSIITITHGDSTNTTGYYDDGRSNRLKLVLELKEPFICEGARSDSGLCEYTAHRYGEPVDYQYLQAIYREPAIAISKSTVSYEAHK